MLLEVKKHHRQLLVRPMIHLFKEAENQLLNSGPSAKLLWWFQDIIRLVEQVDKTSAEWFTIAVHGSYCWSVSLTNMHIWTPTWWSTASTCQRNDPQVNEQTFERNPLNNVQISAAKTTYWPRVIKSLPHVHAHTETINRPRRLIWSVHEIYSLKLDSISDYKVCFLNDICSLGSISLFLILYILGQ